MRNVFAYLFTLTIVVGCANTKPVGTEAPTNVIDAQSKAAGWQLIANESGKPTLTTTSVDYTPFVLMLGDMPVEALLGVTHQTHGKAPDTLTIEAYQITDTALYLLSSTKLPGSNYQFFNTANNILQVSLPGTAQTPATNQLLNLANGELFCHYTQPLATLTLPTNAVKRYTGYHNRNSAIPLSTKGTPDNWAGVLTYAKPNGAIASVALVVNDSRLLNQMRQFPPEVFYLVKRDGTTIRTRDLDLYPPADQPPITTPTGFYIELNFGKIRAVDNIQIPVTDDQWTLPVLEDERIQWVPINE